MQTSPVEIRVYRSLKTLDWKLLPTKVIKDSNLRVSYGDWISVDDKTMRLECRTYFQGFIDSFSSNPGNVPSAFDRLSPSQRRSFFKEHIYISAFFFSEVSELEIEPIKILRGGNGIGMAEYRETIKWPTTSANLYRHLSNAAGVL